MPKRTRLTRVICHIPFALLALVLAACSGGQIRRVSEPSVSIQQLSVRSDGTWDVQLRLQNYSSVPMRFERVALDLTFDTGPAARLEFAPGLEVGPESGDVASTSLTPLPAGRARLAAALADGTGLSYTLSGSVNAAAQDGKPRTWTVKHESALSPVPGLPGTLR